MLLQADFGYNQAAIIKEIQRLKQREMKEKISHLLYVFAWLRLKRQPISEKASQILWAEF